MKTLSDLIAKNATLFGDKPCIVLPDGTEALNYRELDRQATHFAHFLADQGCPRGARLLIAIHNTPAFFIGFIGALRAGVVAIPVDSNLARGELKKIIEHAEPHALLVSEASAQKLADIAPERLRIGISEAAFAGALQFDPGARRSEAANAPAPVDPAELAMILYTSGTTGLPKGVMHSQAGLAAKLVAIQQWFGFDADYRSLCLLPTHFGHGLICNCLATFYYGGTLVLCPPFDLDLVQKLWTIIERNKVNSFSTVPAIIRLLLRLAKRGGPRQLGSLKFVTCASAPLGQVDVEAFERTFGVPLLNCYGITETSSWTACSPRYEEAQLKRDRASVGIGMGCEIRAVDTEGHALPADQSGELQIRGPSVMLGYFKNPQLTAESIKDGWFCSGDIGKVDQQGRVYILGRIKELIIRAGLNVYPADIDAILLTHPEIEEACSLGLEDALLGEKVVAAVVRKEGGTLTEQAVVDFCRTEIAAYKCPERIVFVDAIPRTSRGKINRANLRPLFMVTST